MFHSLIYLYSFSLVYVYSSCILYILQTFFSIFLIYILFFILFFQSFFSFHLINLLSYISSFNLHIPFIYPSFLFHLFLFLLFSHLWSFLLTSSILMLSPSNILSLPIFFSFQLINLLFTYMFFIYSLPPSPPPSFLNIKLNSLFLIFSSFTHIIFPLLPTSLFHFHEIPSRLTWTIPPLPSTPSFIPFRLFPLPYVIAFLPLLVSTPRFISLPFRLPTSSPPTSSSINASALSLAPLHPTSRSTLSTI